MLGNSPSHYVLGQIQLLESSSTLSQRLHPYNFDQLVHIVALGYLIAGRDFSCFPEGRRLNVL